MTSWILYLTPLLFSTLNADSCIEYSIDGAICREYHDSNGYYFDDGEEHRLYTYWDNKTVCDYDTIVDDPLLVIRTKSGSAIDPYTIEGNWLNWTRFSHFHYPPHTESVEVALPNYIPASTAPVEETPAIIFDHTPVKFPISGGVWEISRDPTFNSSISTLSGKTEEDYVSLHPLAETMVTAGETYYFRSQMENGEWSTPIPFVSLKPKAVLAPLFTPEEPLTLSWTAEADTNYWVFASNSLDFVPEIYTSAQIDGIDSSGKTNNSPNENLFVVTQSDRIFVSDAYCFYRIIPEKNGMFGTPSPLIYVYSPGQKPVRSVLAREKEKVSRVLFPTDHKTALQTRAVANVKPPHVSSTAWTAIARWIMPLNHAVRGPLDRIFSQQRVLTNRQSLADAGFTNTQPGKGSDTIVTEHPKVKFYILKLYLDDQPITEEWRHFVHRASGAELTRNAIKAHKYYPYLVSPYAWIYPLPAAPRGRGSFAKDFILVADKMPRLSDADNIKRWYKDMDRQRIKAIFTLVEELGLVNATTAQNLPWTRNKRNVFIDFEKHHVWPTNVIRLQQWLRPELQHYLRQLISGQG